MANANIHRQIVCIYTCIESTTTDKYAMQQQQKSLQDIKTSQSHVYNNVHRRLILTQFTINKKHQKRTKRKQTTSDYDGGNRRSHSLHFVAIFQMQTTTNHNTEMKRPHTEYMRSESYTYKQRGKASSRRRDQLRIKFLLTLVRWSSSWTCDLFYLRWFDRRQEKRTFFAFAWLRQRHRRCRIHRVAECTQCT